MKLIAPAYVKPFVKRQKNDMADAEAICEAAQRPTMRFVQVKSDEQQAGAAVFRIRDLLVRQHTQLINALRGQLAEYGLVVAHGPSHVTKLIDRLRDRESGMPSSARLALELLVTMLETLGDKIAELDLDVGRRAREDQAVRQLMAIPGIGPVTATALVALAPDASSFRCGRDFAAWLGLTPRQHSTGGKQKLGATSKMGERSRETPHVVLVNGTVMMRRDRQSSMF